MRIFIVVLHLSDSPSKSSLRACTGRASRLEFCVSFASFSDPPNKFQFSDLGWPRVSLEICVLLTRPTKPNLCIWIGRAHRDILVRISFPDMPIISILTTWISSVDDVIRARGMIEDYKTLALHTNIPVCISIPKRQHKIVLSPGMVTYTRSDTPARPDSASTHTRSLPTTNLVCMRMSEWHWFHKGA